MKLITVIWIAIALLSCKEQAQQSVVLKENYVSVEVPQIDWSIHEVFFDRSNSTWLVKNDSSRVSGYVNEYLQSGGLFRKFGLVNGKKQGVQLTYFPDGRLQFEETYHSNKLQGIVRRWSLESGYQLIALLQYHSGKPHGEQKKWYNTGELHKHLNLEEGREEGMQKAYRKNGALYANYQAKNGRVFGLKRSNLCYELDNEQIVFTQ